ncbi:phage tail assembly chaperone [Pseudomonas corrugata]|uniref:phage tail assembly chaperone n=1 Tax=Pseudomonas corrugata TaxID=47879 RepID=UPI0015862373|nr:phage tail assembly chaperone [Pseudomonas corrugata]MCI0996051.1 phage tail protein [Pseudomonas corrugata]NUT65098.1 phage tail protein [Pseudomonas corrugata]
MTLYSSKTTGGFYDDSIHSAEQIPLDSIEITPKLHAELHEGQSMGKRISSNEDGYPILVDPPALSSEVLAANERVWRDEQLVMTDGMVARHRDELEEMLKTTLSVEQYSELQAYRQVLRNWPETSEFPLVDHRPIAPSWLPKRIQ